MTPDEIRKLRLRIEAGRLRARAAMCDMGVSAIDATAALARFGDVVRRGYEAAFLELVVRYDESGPAVPAKAAQKRKYSR